MDALVDAIIGKIFVLEVYDKEVRSEKESFLLPSVVFTNKIINPTSAKTIRCNKKNLFYRDSGICQYCSIHLSLDESTIDHVVPKSKNGKHEWTNVVISCYKCNQKKGNKLLEKTSMILKSQPKRVLYHEIILGQQDFNSAWKQYCINK